MSTKPVYTGRRQPIASSRRDFIKTLGAAGLATALGSVLARRAFAADKITVGVIYVGPKDDYGYSQAQAQAAAAIKKLPGVTVIEQEKVAETTDVQKVMASMVEECRSRSPCSARGQQLPRPTSLNLAPIWS